MVLLAAPVAAAKKLRLGGCRQEAAAKKLLTVAFWTSTADYGAGDYGTAAGADRAGVVNPIRPGCAIGRPRGLSG